MMLGELPILNERFSPLESFQQRNGQEYGLLPFRFTLLDSERYVLSNLVGEHVVLSRDLLRKLVQHSLARDSNEYRELKSKQFVFDGDSHVAIDLLAVKYRTKQAFLSQFTSLFMFVVSLRCDHSCPYCQVSRQSADRLAFDMSRESADRAIEFLFRSPSPLIKVEFQGGEPLLNFELIKHIIERVEERNTVVGRDVQFVIASNLAYLTDDILCYCAEHGVMFSTSLDGPQDLHNHNRPRPGQDSYQLAVQGIHRVRETLGHNSVSALMTTTETSLSQGPLIVDEYVSQGFSSIFLRPMSPYGFAVKTGQVRRYNVDDWLQFYFKTLAHIIDLNNRGVFIREEYASLILRKLLTPFPTGYVDLQSPAGIGISCLLFNYDGDIYASDESRMLAETGDKKFRLGNLHSDTFETIYSSETLISSLYDTMTEGAPMCSDCGFLPYCGSDPVFHYATQGDAVGFKPTSDFCQKNMAIFRHLIRLLEDDPIAARVLKSWM